jgi:hypothetical protein
MLQTVDDDILLQYMYLCENPLRGDIQIELEYHQLINHPRVMSVAFLRPEVLMVQTDEIIVSDKGRRLIGKFIIFLIRRQIAGYWEVDFRFWNVSNPILIEDDDPEATDKDVVFIHPHIMPAKDDLLGCANGALCISKGQFAVYQHMRKGEMHLAVPCLIKILESYPTGVTYLDAQHWPLWKGGKDDT